jgi:DNA-binding transcriptional LysR family regulator
MNLLHGIRTFLRVVETGSFSAVARECNSSQSSVTRTIEQLEGHFGIRLLHRTTRRLSLTDDGENLLSHARAMLAAAEELETTLRRRQESPTGLVRIGLPSDMAILVTARLAALLRRFPGLSVELVIGERFGDMVEERLDLVIRTGQSESASSVTRVIATCSRAVVAAPAYLDERGVPPNPKALAHHRCIVHETGPDSNRWTFTGPARSVDVRVAGPLHTDSTTMVRHMALAGHGIAYLLEPQVADDIRANRLCRLLPAYTPTQEQTFVVYPSRRHVPLRTRVLIDFFVAVGREVEARSASSPTPVGDERGPLVNSLRAA